MAILSTTWLIVEAILIPHGFQKWYSLSFFIHPLLLVFSQIFIWVDCLTVRLSNLAIWSVILRAYRLLRDRITHMLHYGGSEDYQVTQNTGRRFEVLETTCAIQSIVLHDCCRVLQTIGGKAGDKKHGFEEEEVDEEETNDEISEDSETDEFSSTGFSSFESPIRERALGDEVQGVEIDEFYNSYTERMDWFDLLNYERTCGISEYSLIHLARVGHGLMAHGKIYGLPSVVLHANFLICYFLHSFHLQLQSINS